MKRNNIVLDFVFIGFIFHFLYFLPTFGAIFPVIMMMLWFFPAWDYYKWTYKIERLEK